MARIVQKAGDVPKRSLWQRIKDIALTDVGVIARGGVKDGSLEQLEELLLEADFGVTTSMRLIEEVERLAQRGQIRFHFHRGAHGGVGSQRRAPIARTPWDQRSPPAAARSLPALLAKGGPGECA